MLLLIELGLCFAAVVLALACPRLGNRWFTALERRLSRFAARRHLAVLTVLLLALGARSALLPIEPIPTPGIHDEFSYLLMADTFSHGRLTNPPHPMWKHFETFHVNMQPTYCSKYFPAQGIFLAFGQVFLGHPFWGVWLSTGLMCAAICWALQAWMPPSWAFLAGILAILRLGMFSYWANSYWGGSVAAIGGALVLGALPRIKRKQRVRDALLMALGLAILANSRPYEGLIYSLPVLTALLVWSFRQKKVSTTQLFRQVAFPMSVVLVLTFGWMGYYFWRTTGHYLRTPYAVYSGSYDTTPIFPWTPLKSPPNYRHAVMKNFYFGFVMEQYVVARGAPLVSLLGRALNFWLFFIGPALTIPFFALAWVLPYGAGFSTLSKKTQFFLALNSIAFASLLVIVFFNLHYAAPMICAWYGLLLTSMRAMWINPKSETRRSLVGAIIFACLMMSAIRIVASGFAWSHESLLDGSVPTQAQLAKEKVLSNLRHEPGKQLVLVQYSANHNPHAEWVYNDADIENSKIVWAREMDNSANQELLSYFKDRTAWRVFPDDAPPRIERYSEREIHSATK